MRSQNVEYPSSDCVTLYGRMVWADPAQGDYSSRRPGVLLVHTAVGPHDLYLYWKAEALAALGLVVLIVDMYGDSKGDGWDKAWQTERRDQFKQDASLYCSRMEAAMAALRASPLVDPSRVATLGYCFGGLPLLYYARSNPEGLLAAISFHGDAQPPPALLPMPSHRT